jgi:hypothetical protein
VTLSWREAEAFDLGLPSVEDHQEAIVVEPPSQLVAKPRRRRPEPVDYDEDDAWARPTTPEHEPTSSPQESEPSAGQPEAGANTSRPGRARRVVAVVLLLVVLAVVAWYFLLRDSGDGSAAPQRGGAAVVAAASAPSTPALPVS